LFVTLPRVVVVRCRFVRYRLLFPVARCWCCVYVTFVTVDLFTLLLRSDLRCRFGYVYRCLLVVSLVRVVVVVEFVVTVVVVVVVALLLIFTFVRPALARYTFTLFV